MGKAQERVLQAVASGFQYGFEIMASAQMTSGAVYQALAGLERRGYVRSRWEDPALAETARRPRRKYYAITKSGLDALSAVAARYRDFQQNMPTEIMSGPEYDTTA